MKTMSCIFAALIPLVSFAQGSPESPVIRIKVADEMYKRLGIKKEEEAVACPSHCSGRGFCAREPVNCILKYEFENIVVDSVIAVESREPDVVNVAGYKEEQSKDWANCRSTPYDWDEQLKYTSQTTISVTNKSVLTDVQAHSTQVGLSAKLQSSIGATYGEQNSNTSTVELTKDSGSVHLVTFELTRQDKQTVPPNMHYFEYFSDVKKKIVVPVKITATIDGNVQRKMYWLPTGRVWESALYSTIKGLARDPKDRTFVVDAEIEVQGSDRTLHVRLLEKKLTSTDLACKFFSAQKPNP